MEILALRFDAPLMSFGGPAVDHIGVTSNVPALSMITGLFANALGWTHHEAARLQLLQDRVRYAVRCDRRGIRLVDYQTVDLGQSFLRQGWTTLGRPAGREGSKAAAEGTHVRQRHYLADAIYTVVLTLHPAGEEPGLGDLEEALRSPSRPVFLGRKTCLPAAPILLARLQAPTLREALANVPAVPGRGDPAPLPAWWPEEEGTEGVQIAVSDERDWANQIHVGRRFVRHGRVVPEDVQRGD